MLRLLLCGRYQDQSSDSLYLHTLPNPCPHMSAQTLVNKWPAGSSGHHQLSLILFCPPTPLSFLCRTQTHRMRFINPVIFCFITNCSVNRWQSCWWKRCLVIIVAIHALKLPVPNSSPPKGKESGTNLSRFTQNIRVSFYILSPRVDVKIEKQ